MILGGHGSLSRLVLVLRQRKACQVFRRAEAAALVARADQPHLHQDGTTCSACSGPGCHFIFPARIGMAAQVT